MIERILRVSKESLCVITGQLAALIGTLVSIKYFTVNLTADEYGRFAFGLIVATLFSQLLYGPLNNGITRFYFPAIEKKIFIGYFNSILELVSKVSTISFLLSIFIIVALYVLNKSEWTYIVALSSLYAIVTGVNSILNGIQNSARHRSIVALHQGMECWIRLLMAVYFFSIFGSLGGSLLLAYLGASTIVLFSQLIFFYKSLFSKLMFLEGREKCSGEVISYSMPFASWGVFTWIQQGSDRWIIERSLSMGEAGLYTVLLQIGFYPITFVTNVVVQFLTPIFYARAGATPNDKSARHVNSLSLNLLYTTIFITVVSFVAVLIFKAQLINFFVSENYSELAPMLPWMVLAGGIFASSQIIALNLMSQMKTREMIPYKIGAAISGVVFNFVGINYYGIAGAVGANVGFSLISFIWVSIIILKK